MATYDESKGMFLIDGQQKFEKNMSIDEINTLKKSLKLTILGDYDIDLLKNLAQNEFGWTFTTQEFTKIPIKNIFIGASDDNLTIGKLMVMSYDFKNKKIIEKFSVNYKIKHFLKLLLLLVITILIIIFVNII